MEQREGYKKTKIGWIPEDWESISLGSIGEFLKGKGIAKKDLTEDGIPCVRYGEIYTVHHWVLKKFYSFITSETASQSTKILQDDILFAGSGETVEDIGKAVVYLGDDEAYAGGDIIIFRPKKNQSAFLSACLDTEFSNKQKRKLGQGNSVVHIYPTGLKKLLIPVPPLPEQQKIASILTTVDDKILSIENQIQQSEQLKKGLMEKLLTEGIGHTEFKDTKIGRIPKGWDVAKIFDIVEKIQDGNYGADYPKANEMLTNGVPFLTSTVISKNSRVNTNKLKYISEEKHKLLKKAHLKKNDVIFTNRGANVGAVAINPDFLDGANIGPQLTLLRCKDASMLYELLFFYLQSPTFERILKSVDSGSAMNFLSIKTTGNFHVILPSLPEQKQIASILSTVDDKIDVLNQKKSEFQILKKGLSQQLLTGQMRVKV